jgi:pyridoxal phosphate enzyme (YggS family)
MEKNRYQEIANNYQFIMDNIARTCQRTGRKPEDVELVVVSKYKAEDLIQAAYDAGARIFGENYPELTLPKIDSLKHNQQLQWHMIGHLQSRKVKLIPGNFSLMHSLDSYKLAEKLNQTAQDAGMIQRVLLEVNVAGEISKGGWDASNQKNWYKIMEELYKIIDMPGLKVEGLMSMPPLWDNPEFNRPFFKTLRQFQEFLMNETDESYWKDLSIGTSSDYKVAIEEGAKYVRIGQAILGRR